MEIEEAKDILQNCIGEYVLGTYCIYACEIGSCNGDCEYITAIDTVIAELNKQEKIIKNKNNIISKNIKRKVGGRR